MKPDSILSCFVFARRGLRLPALLFALALPVVAQSVSSLSAPASEPMPAVSSIPIDPAALKLNIARNGAEVLISWYLPVDQVKGMEIYRNASTLTKGRKRLGAPPSQRLIFSDTVPEAGTIYWYWLKVTFNNGEVLNVGPVITPPPAVWTP